MLADEIVGDVLMPSLRTIERRLDSSRKLLARKAGFSVVLGGLATTVGAFTAIPQLIAGGVAIAAGGATAAQHKFREEMRDVELSDMYFLWKAAHG